MQLKAAILSAFLAIAPASAHLRNVHDMNNKNGATTIDDEAALRSHITSWIDELKDSTAANNDSRRLDTSQHCVDVKDSAANILASALEGCGTAASGSLAGGIATNESPNPTCLLLLCEAHFKAADIITPECEPEDPDFKRNDILACRLTPGYLPPAPPTANDVVAGSIVLDQLLDVVITGTTGFAHVLDNVNGTFGFDLELRGIDTQAANGECFALSIGKVAYVPDDGFLGEDSCDYQVCYGKDTRYADQCAIASVSATVVAQPTSSPTAAPTFGCDITLELPEPHIPLVSQETCEGKLTELTLKYNGGDRTQSNNGQGGKFECEDFGDGPPNTEDDVLITVFDKKGNLIAEDVDVSVGDILRLEPPTGDAQFESEIDIFVRDPQVLEQANDDNGTGDDEGLLQKITIHTSCSQDLRLLDIFGSTQVFAYADTKKDSPVTVVQPVTVSGGLVNNNGQAITGTLFELNGEAIDDVPDPIHGDGFSFEETMMTDLSQESLEYTLDFEGKLEEFSGQICDTSTDVSVPNRNLGPSLTELAASVPGLATLVSLLELTGLDVVLDGPGSFTAFAPTDDAFANLPEGALEALVTEDPPITLRKVLLYHVARPDVESKDLSNGQVIETFDGGNTVEVTINADGVIKINDSEVTGPDNLANNGVAHIIDAVLIPKDFVVPAAITEEDV